MNKTGQSLIVKSLGLRLIGMLCLILLISIIGFAQSDNAQISGFVKDITGAVLPQVKAVAKSEGRSFERSAVTNQEGYYVIPNLPPGFYTLTAEHAGFKRFEITNKKLDPSIATTVEIILQTGAVTDTVSVVASTASVQSETATVGKLVERQQIELTELNGRNPLFLALTKAGVGGGNLAGLSFGLTTGGFNINGSRGQNNLITFDGAVGIRTRSNATFSIGTADLDSTQEVQILTANYNAEYGRSSGGQIRIVSKSGTRDFHGLFYEYFRNSALNANSWGRNANPTGRSCDAFPGDQQCRPSPFRYNQFGYNLNGPVLLPFTDFNKDRKKLFWSFGQEWVRERTSTLRTLLVPTLKMRQGDFSELAAPNQFFSTPRFIKDPSKPGACNATSQAGCFNDGGIINKIPVDKLSQNGMALLKALPEPIPGFAGPGGANWFADRPNQVNQLKSTISVDFYPTESHQVRWRSQIFGSKTVTAFPFGGDPGFTPRIFDLPNRWASVNWVWTISPNWINEALVAASKDRVNISIDTNNARFQRSLHGINYPYIFPEGKEITDKIPTTAGLGPFAVLDGGPYPASSSGPIYQFSNNMTNIRGNHTIKFGVTFERSGQNDFDQINVAGTPGGTNNQNGRFAFNDLTAGGTGTAITNAAIGLFDTYSEIGPRSYTPYRGHMYEWFFQDSWKVTPSLRLELGLRHSIIQPHYSLWGNIVVFDQEFYNPAIAVTQDPRTGFITSDPRDLRARFNGLVIPGDGWPEAGRGPGRVPIATTGEFDFLFRGVGKSYSEIHKDNFQPRIGIAYAFNEKNVIRVGAGRFFDRLGVSDSVFLGGNPPLQPQVSITAGSVDNPGGTAGNVFPLQITTQDRAFPNPEAWTWNATFQREIGFATTVDVGYVGRRGLHQQRERNINQLQPGTVNPGGTNPNANPDPLRPFKGFGIIRVTNNDASSTYHSFQVEMNRRFTRGLSYGIAYTLSKSFDDGSAQRDIIPNAFDASALWGPSDFDRRHVLVANVIYELPFFRDRSSLSGKLLGGWTINAVSVFRTGTPFSVTTNQDFAGVGVGSGNQFWVVNGAPERLGQFTDASNPTGQWLQVCSIELAPGQTCPAANRLFTEPAPGTFNAARVRNMFRNPGDQNHNLGLFKDFAITESQRIQFRFEAFNWLNHPNWNGVASTDPRNANFGKVNGKGGERNLQFALRYQF